MGYKISADTGGTFIDVVVQDAAGGQVIAKALTTRDRVFRGMSEAISYAAEQLGMGLAELFAQTDAFVYGTTTATNAIVTRTAAKTAFLTTSGFPDTLVLKEGGKTDGHDFTKDFPAPYVPRAHTFEVVERIGSEGSVDTPLDEAALRATLAQIGEQQFEAIGVCLLWSVANGSHERRVGEIIAEVLPGVPFTLSHEIAPIVREYRRASATVIDASLKPLMQAHFRQLVADLRDAGYAGPLLVSTSMGGVMTVDEVIAAPIHTARSGPSMAPVAGLAYSLAEDMGGDMIVCDTGGTTFDVGISRDAQLVYSRDTWLGEQWEGDLLGISSVDIRSIGAGGGSIAWVDDGGLLRVGPQSAGSKPGPACYGLGGTEATLSDAACVLGYFDPDFFLGGRLHLDREAAERAVATVADQLGMSVRDTAWGILSLATDAMVKAVAEITITQGLNPRESTIVGGGGAAGINLMQIAAELGAPKVMLPRAASALSATGMQYADVVKEMSRPLFTTTAAFDAEGTNAAIAELKSELTAFLETISMSDREHRIELYAEARYQSQVWDIDTRVPVESFETAADIDALIEEFHKSHEALFAFRDAGAVIEVLTWKARLIVPLEKASEAHLSVPMGSESKIWTRDCYFGNADYESTRIYGPGSLATGDVVVGPAIIVEPTTTLVVFPGMSAEVSPSQNYILHTV